MTGYLQDPQAVVLSIKEFEQGCFAISSNYHPPLIALYKQLAIRPTWHPDQKLWSFRDESYEELMQKLLAADFAGQSGCRPANLNPDWLNSNT